MEWKAETMTWMEVKYVKEENPIGLAEYAVARKLEDEPHHTLHIYQHLVDAT